MSKSPSIGICGVGHYLPDTVIDNQHFVDRGMDTTPEWIQTRTGIETRHISDASQYTSDLAASACQMAIDSSGISKDLIDFIIVATATPDHSGFPSTACLVQSKLQLSRSIPCFDISAACSGFAYGVSIAYGFLKSQMGTYGLVVGAEQLSKVVDWKDRRSAILFGDGAGCALIGPVSSGGILGIDQGADGNSHHILSCVSTSNRESFSGESILGETHMIQMDGPAVFKKGVQVVVDSIQSVCASSGMPLSSIDYFICHQANRRILESVGKKLNIPIDAFLMNIESVGNTSAASIPLVLSHYHQQNKFKPGDRLCLVGFGAGFTWSSIIIEWSHTL